MSWVEEWQRMRVDGFRRLIVSADRAAEIQRRQPYDDVGRPLGISTGRLSRWIAPKIRVPKKLRAQSEKDLAKFGLSLQQQKLQDTQSVIVPVREGTPEAAGATVEGFDRHTFDKPVGVLSDNSGVLSRLDDSDLFRGNSQRSVTNQLAFSIVRTREHHRRIPDWARNDAQLRDVISAMYPKWTTHKNWQERAEKAAAVLYKYFRALEHTETIAQELFPDVDLPVALRKVEYKIAKAREVGEQLFAKAVTEFSAGHSHGAPCVGPMQPGTASEEPGTEAA
jgi:hypothetical protein